MNEKKIPAKYGVLIIVIVAVIYLGSAIARGQNAPQIMQNIINGLWLIPIFVVVSLIYHFMTRKKV